MVACLHVAIRDAQEPDDPTQLLAICCRLGTSPEIGPGDNFEKRDARPIEVDQAAGTAGELICAAMHILACVLFQMGPAWLQ